MYINKLESDIRKKDLLCRYTKDEKSEFRDLIITELKKSGYKAKVDNGYSGLICKDINNVITDNIDEADYIITAHYDTPTSNKGSIINILSTIHRYFGNSKPISIIFGLIILFVLILILEYLDNLHPLLLGFICIILLIETVMSFSSLLFNNINRYKNKFNLVDNTSGVIGVLALANRLNGNKNIAFILFDKEENGCKGSSQYMKKIYNSSVNFRKKIIINLDCICSSSKDDFWVLESNKLPDTNPLLRSIAEKLDNTIINKKSLNSDHKSFKENPTLGIGKVKKAKIKGYYLENIHTNKDTELYPDDIQLLTNTLYEYLIK
ncbi:MAG: M28 family peptidase [Clostridium paraputrificum]|uniref:M28 family peptidase n=1 Tax=Clostridium sp. TaxID=1506 RepID=UPI0025C70D7D|nr:M28 family peptidase [Clostridium sp.]MBS5926173.1 M28 family peptidase [Clostridium sp.]